MSGEVRPTYYKATLRVEASNVEMVGGHAYIHDVQPFHIIRALKLDFFGGSALKYLWRLGRKSLEKEERLSDAKKALTYIQQVINDIEEEK